MTSINLCKDLHQKAANARRFQFPYETELPLQNGVYLLFEKGETSHGFERIVRVGTHRGDGRLFRRLHEHFVAEHKDRSIFRKNIGRAILNSNTDPFLKYWNLDLMGRKNRELYFDRSKQNRQLEIESLASEYIVNNFTFCLIPVPSREERHDLERKLIPLLNYCSECRPSVHWLGLNSPIPKIRQSGLWLVHHLEGTPLTLSEFVEKIEFI